MKKNFLRLVLVGLFALSAIPAAVVFAKVTWAQAPPPCPSCDGSLGCAGSRCTCQFQGGGQYACNVVK